ncbi:MAG: hypothetical protein P8100_09310 [bacterium]
MWQGGTSSDWSDASNWLLCTTPTGYPDATSAVSLPFGTNNPVISSPLAYAYSINQGGSDLTIQNGSTLVVESTYNLYSGTLTLEGSLTLFNIPGDPAHLNVGVTNTDGDFGEVLVKPTGILDIETGNLDIGSADVNNNASSGSMTIEGGGSVTVGWNLYVAIGESGPGGHQGTLLIEDGGTLTVNRNTFIGTGNGSGTVTNNGTMTVNGIPPAPAD